MNNTDNTPTNMDLKSIDNQVEKNMEHICKKLRTTDQDELRNFVIVAKVLQLIYKFKLSCSVKNREKIVKVIRELMISLIGEEELTKISFENHPLGEIERYCKESQYFL